MSGENVLRTGSSGHDYPKLALIVSDTGLNVDQELFRLEAMAKYGLFNQRVVW